MTVQVQKSQDWRKFFPFQVVRKEQESAIEFALKEFAAGKRFVVCELGTGVGKSAIGLTIARAVCSESNGNAYFLTTQKILQDQYVNDFPTMKSIKSKSNYVCNFKTHQNCAESDEQLKIESPASDFYGACGGDGCKYKKEKQLYMTAKESITNFPFFLADTKYAKAYPRDILVIDEGHNIVTELSKFVEVILSEYFCKTVLNIEFPPVDSTEKKVIKWFKEVYAPKLSLYVKDVETAVEKIVKGKNDAQSLTLIKRLEILKQHMSKTLMFLSIYDEDNWIMNEIAPRNSREMRKYEFKPIDISPFCEEYLFRMGKKVLIMSATILNQEGFCESVGIPKDNVGMIRIGSPFPVENRPIVYIPVGKMGKDTIDETLPKLRLAIEELINLHKNEKGIIHCHTYRIARYLKENIVTNRFLIHGSNDREEILDIHLKSPKPTILLTPSMSEGVDLKGDASRFQIICKIPYPFLGDKITKKRMRKWKWWYPMQTAKTLIQSIGRSVRSMDDHAVSYILDEDWSTFFGKHREFFSEEFTEALK